MEKKLVKGCVVLMKSESGLTGYGNYQCISNVCEPLGEISLYGHNQCYQTYDIQKIIEYPVDAKELEAQLAESVPFEVLQKACTRSWLYCRRGVKYCGSFEIKCNRQNCQMIPKEG